MGQEHLVESFGKASHHIRLVGSGLVVVNRVNFRFTESGVDSIEVAVGFGFKRDGAQGDWDVAGPGLHLGRGQGIGWFGGRWGLWLGGS